MHRITFSCTHLSVACYLAVFGGVISQSSWFAHADVERVCRVIPNPVLQIMLLLAWLDRCHFVNSKARHIVSCMASMGGVATGHKRTAVEDDNRNRGHKRPRLSPATLADRHQPHILQAPGWTDLGQQSELGWWPGSLAAGAEHYMTSLQGGTPWQQRQVRIMGRMVPQPRLVALMADGPHLRYTYTGLTLEPIQWSGVVLQIKQHVEELTGAKYNTCLLNYYRSGSDHISWHSDDEALYGPHPTIASVSLGCERDFMLRAKADRTCRIKLPLKSGDVLAMGGSMQQHWQHSVPKRKAVQQPRISLTFRQVLHPEMQP